MSEQPKKKGGKLFKFAVGLVLLAALAIAGAFVYGNTLPETFEVKKEVDIARWDIAVYAVLADVPAYPSWAAHVKEIKDYKKNSDGTATWTTVLKGGSEMNMHATVARRPRQFKVEIVGHPMFSGYWQYDMAEVGKEGAHITRVTLTEKATIPSPFIRLGFKLMGHADQILEQHLAELKKKCEADKPAA